MHLPRCFNKPHPVVVCRFVLVLQGEAQVMEAGEIVVLPANNYAYFPPGSSAQ